MTTKLAVVILNYNGKHWLERFLPSVTAYSQGFEVIVADNASTDNSISFLESHYPDIRLIQMHQNYGFAGGYNEALNQIEATYYVLLNSDVEVCPQWIEPVLEFMETHPEVAACQPKLLTYDRKDEFEYAGAAGGFVDAWGYPFCRGRLFDTMEKDTGQYDTNQEVFWASGACLFIRSALYHQAGGLDHDFFAHMEEIDLCWRLKNEGYKIYYIGESHIYHVGGGTLSTGSARKTFLNFRNNLALLTKNLPAGRLLQTLLVRGMLDGMAAGYFLLQGNFSSAREVGRAYFLFFLQFRKWWCKRQKNTQKPAHKDLYPYSVVFQYFLQKKKRFQDLKNIRG